jgi:hypothetical protein
MTPNGRTHTVRPFACLALTLFALAAAPRAAEAQDCDRACLEGLLDTYIEHVARGAVERGARLTLLDLETQAES